MALIAILRVLSRSKASRLDFWMKKRMKSRDAKIATMISSKIVKPCFVFIGLL